MNCKNKSFMTKRKAFTLIELLIVIAIIGILFIVLVSKVDFATDKAKATGVQTDFRSFQVAFDTVAKENAGFNTFGWDTGDINGNRIRDSYDKGDVNKNGKQDPGEIFVGSKVYGETWTGVYTLTNPADANDTSAIFALESAINKNLDPKLHITIADDLTITMANGAQDPWNTEYHGYYISNAVNDGKDRGAIVMYSNGANQEFGSEHSITNGVVTVTVPGNNKFGKDDYSIVSCYTYMNGYGEVLNITTGFSNNQVLHTAPSISDIPTVDDGGSNDNSGDGNNGNNQSGNVSGGNQGISTPTLTLNEYGFYFNQPYQATIDGVLYEYVFYPDGSASLWVSYSDEHHGMYVPAGGAVYTENTITIGGDPATISDNGTTLIASGIVMILNPTTNQKLKYNVLYENANEGVALMFKSDGSVSLYDGDILLVTLPAGSAVLHDYYVDLTIDGETMPCPVYPNGSKMIVSDLVLVCGCNHERTIIKNIAATCGTAGMNNAEVCVECEAIIKEGSAVPATGVHAKTEFINIKASTCRSEGYTGDEICINCGCIVNRGNTIPIGDHSVAKLDNVKSATCTKDGYTGDGVCECGQIVKVGEVVYAIGHKLQGNACTECSYKIVSSYFEGGPGLYETGSNYTVLLKGWDDLIKEGVLADNGKANQTSEIAGDLVIPDIITSLAAYSYNNCTYLTGVILPNTLTEINQSVFEGCTNLQNIVIPDAVTIIGANAFKNCTRLSSVVFGEESQLTSVGQTNSSSDGIFAKCTNLTSIKLPNKLVQIPKGMFYGCTGFTSVGPVGSGSSVEIPDNVTYIDTFAFSHCTGLINVVIPNTVTEFGQWVFNGCTNLVSVQLSSGMTNIGSYAFQECANLKNVIIPNSIKIIGGCVFRDCTSLATIIIPNSVTLIGDSAFARCTNLQSIVFNENSELQTVGSSAFSGCTNLKVVDLSLNNKLCTIESNAFNGCSSLETIIFPKTLTVVKARAFENCTSLNNVVFNGSIQEWNAITFKDHNGYCYHFHNVPATQVHCSDGLAELPKYEQI